MNKLIKGLVISVLTASLIYVGFAGYVSIKVNQEITDLQITYLQNKLDYLSEEQINNDINDAVKFLEFKNNIRLEFLQFQYNNNERFINILEILKNYKNLFEYSYQNFETIFKKLEEPNIELLLNSSVIVQTPTSNGSGTVIKKDNGFIYILTCYHVIEEKFSVIEEETEEEEKEKGYKNPFMIKEAIEPPEETQTNIVVSYLIKNKNNEEIGDVEYKAELIKYDEEKDLALLRIFIEDENLNVIPIATEEPKIGDTVYSIGNPLSTNRTLSKGILSGKEEHFYI